MSPVRPRRATDVRAWSAVRRCFPLLATSALGSCGMLTDPTVDSPDFIFSGTIPRVGPPTFHQFVPPRSGDLLASVKWTSHQARQTVCVIESDIADGTAKCGALLVGSDNSVTGSVRAGRLYVVYATPDYSSDAPYTIEVRIH